MEKTFMRGEKNLLKALMMEYFPLKSDDEFKNYARHKNIRNKNDFLDYNKLMELIKSKENEMNNELVSKYFFVPKLGNLLKQMKDLKNNPEKNRVLVNIIKSRIKDLKNEIEKMTEDEIKTEKPDEIVDIAEKILKFKEQLENEG